VDFDAQKAADRVAELIAEGSVLARGWAERFARRREDGAPTEAPTDAPIDPIAPVKATMSSEDPWSAACDDARGPDAARTESVDPVAAGGVPDPGEDTDALMAALRATVARRLGVPADRIRVTVALDDPASATGSRGAGSSVADAASAGPAVDGVVVRSPMTNNERDPIDALTATLDDLAARARTRLSEELGVRLPDIIAEIRFPAGGRPSVRIRPSARGSSGASETEGTPDLEAIVRRLLLGRDAR
jgi:hypothetical protein